MCSLLVLVLFLTPALSQDTPLVQLIKEAIYEADNYLIQHHLQEKDIPSFNHSTNLLQLQVSGGHLGNFSTLTLIGTSVINQTDKIEGTSYYFDLALGLLDLEVELEYSIKILKFIFSSGTVLVKNTGNAFGVKAVINTYSGSTPCDAELEGVDLLSLGSSELSFKPWGILKWFLSKIFSYCESFWEPHVKELIDKEIKRIVLKQEFQAQFAKLACIPFNSMV